MTMRWRKVMGDMQMYRWQIASIALVLMLGTAGVVAGLNAQAILKREIAVSYAAAASPDIALWFDGVDSALRSAVLSYEGIAAADAKRVVFTRVQVNNGTWLPMRLTVMPNFNAQTVGEIHLHGGTWPNHDGAILIEQSGQSLINEIPGGALRIRTPNGKTVTMPIAGFVHDTAVAPSTQDRMIYAFVSPGTAALLEQNPHFDQLAVKLKEYGPSSYRFDQGTTLSAALTSKGWPVKRIEVLASEHPHASLMNAMLNILGVFSVIAFTASAALTGYIVSAWMTRETRTVGVMKSLGARSYQIAAQYVALIAPVVLLAIIIALPIGAVLGHALTSHYSVLLNVDIADWQLPNTLLFREIVLSLCIPLVAMTVPILRAARMTPHAAIHDAGITPLPGPARLAARMVRVPGHIQWTLASRNIWRRPVRLLVMLLALSSGGALMLTTNSNYESFMRVIDASLAHQGHDIELLTPRPATAAQLETIAQNVGDVAIAEVWRRASVTILRPTSGAEDARSNENSRMALAAYPHQSRLFTMPVVQGRAPNGGAREVLISRAVFDSHPWIHIGSQVDLAYAERRITVAVVGVIDELGASIMYSEFDTFDAVTGLSDASTLVRVKIQSEHIEQAVSALDQAFLDAHLAPTQIISRIMIRESLDEHFSVVGEIMRMVALAVALIGAIVLAATTGLNVLDRKREIGVLGALGATRNKIARMFLGEGVVVALLALLLSVIISIPLTLAILDAAEHRLLHVAVPLHFSLFGLAILCSGLLLVVLAVLVVLWGSFRSSVRGNLNYD